MFYKNPISRFILRKDFFHRVKMRFDGYARQLSKNSFDDLKFIFQGRPVTTVFDVGANIGFVTFQFLERFPDAQIYSFEPNPTVFETLKTSYAKEPRVHPQNLGVGSLSGELAFNINKNTGASSFLQATAYHSTHHARKPGKPIQVKVVDLDTFTQENRINEIGILKLDIEGYELEALKGAKRLLTAQAIDAIYPEVNMVRSYVGQPLFHDITKFLEDNGYHIYSIENDFGETAIRQSTIGNAIYISEKFRTFLETKHGKGNCGW